MLTHTNIIGLGHPISDAFLEIKAASGLCGFLKLLFFTDVRFHFWVYKFVLSYIGKQFQLKSV